MSAAARHHVVAAFCLVFLSAVAPVAAGQGPTSPLQIKSAGKTHDFRVEVADSPSERQRGLMYRASLAPDSGMLFDFEKTEVIYMWMKNTQIPLDMLFARPDGTISRIVANTVPFSEELIDSGRPARYVLELPGGTAARLRIKVGDRISHEAIER